MRLAWRDVYIPSPGFAEYYMRHLDSEVQDELCRSITFRVEPSLGHRTPDPWTDEEDAQPISHIIFQAESFNYLPNLRRVTIEYVEVHEPDFCLDGMLISMPKEVTHLEVKDTSIFKPTPTTMEIPMDIQLTNITKLSIMGISGPQVGILAKLCPNLEELDIEGLIEGYSDWSFGRSRTDLGADITIRTIYFLFTWAEDFKGTPGAEKRIVWHSGVTNTNDPDYKRIKALCDENKVNLILVTS